jgi:hypothetical protein
MLRIKHSRKFLLGIALALSLFVVFNSFSPSNAQGALDVQYGTVVQGSISDPSIPQMYSFNGNAGDLVSIRVMGLSAEVDPNVELQGPAAEVLASNDNVLSDLPSLNSALTVRLPSTGRYTVVVGGTVGNFVLTVSARTNPVFSVLELNTPFTVQVPLTNEAEVFTFNTDPLSATTLLIEASPSDLDAIVGVHSSMGETVAIFQGNLDNACISLSPGDELHEVRILSEPLMTGSISLTLGRGPCEIGDTPNPVEAPQVQVTPVGIEGKCAAWSIGNVNVRSGPSVQFGVLTVAVAQRPLEVLGQNETGTWLLVQTPTGQGWVASPLFILIGSCGGIPVIPSAPTPVVSPTPGLPEETPEATSEVTPELTPEVTPEITPEASPEVTQSP